jgi:K+-sensing histidine kinase KdpD
VVSDQWCPIGANVAQGLSTSPERPIWSPPGARVLAGTAIGVLGPLVIAGSVAPIRDQLDGGTVGLMMLVPTAVAAAFGGPLAALVAVIAGSLTHNLLFTVPLLTLRMTEPSEVAGLGAHTLVATAVSFVVVREQQAARLAARRLEAAERLRVLEAVDRARTALLGAVTHDLRTPLAAIAAAASDLRAGDVAFTAEQQQVLLATIAERAASLDRTVEQVLDASRLQAGAVTVLAEAVELRELVEEATTELGPRAVERVVTRMDGPGPLVLVDPVLIVAVLRNLLENALRHGPPGTPVEVQADRAGAAVVVAVTDAGPGLAPDPGDVFAAFQGGSGGAGLGLTIVRGFVELHGGRIDHHEAPGGGATFEFTLPAIEEPEG